MGVCLAIIFQRNSSKKTIRAPSTSLALSDVPIHGHCPTPVWRQGCSLLMFETTSPKRSGVMYLRNKVENDIFRSDGTKEEGAIRLQDASNYQYLLGNYIVDGSLEITDPNIDLNTTILHGNYTGGFIEWDVKVQDHEIPPSAYLKCKPSFFTDLLAPIGPEKNGRIPAQKRFDNHSYFQKNTKENAETYEPTSSIHKSH